ncbi:nuclear transport factor 2 family protein [Nonomuraea lactucae]|uniref:nuclear transport factor 2 family protein n=1 Tax=Nonomuraea lactucae TaxID=2249762 RepID=UPI0013B3D4F2|nr:nuclear transport factor 2 family protein [Nonomuraea lactucae]
MGASQITNLQETKNRTVVAGMYSDLALGHAEAVLLTLSHDIEWVVTAGFPYGGTYVGRDAVLTNVFSRFESDWEDFGVVPDEILAVGDQVIALGHYQGRRRETGKSMKARFAHVWRFEDSVPITFETIADTRTMFATMS